MKHILLAALAVVALAGARADAQSGYDLFQKALATERADGNLREAIQLYERVVKQFSSDRALVARALVRIADCQEKLGQRDASRVYERIVREFADQAESVTVARARLSALQAPALQAVQAVKKIWSGGDVDAMGSPSADGRFLSFTNWTTGDLAIRDIAHGTSRMLTNTGGWEASGDYAEFSLLAPDARQIAYAWFVDKGSDPTAKKCACQYELRVMSLSGADAGKPRVVLPRGGNNYWAQPLAWMPDGKSLLILRSTSARSHDVAVLALANNSLRVVKTIVGQTPSRVSVAPDGRFLALDVSASREVTNRDIMIMPVDGGNETPIVENPAHDYAPTFSHDGTQLLFLSDRTGTNSLWRQPIAGMKPSGPPVLIAPVSANSSILGTSQTGGTYFWTGGPNSNIYSVVLDAAMNATGQPQIAVERFLNTNGMPALSPDGSRLAYLSRRGAGRNDGSNVLVIRNLRSNQDRDLPLGLVPPNGAVSWFPDNRSVLFAARDAVEPLLHYYRVDTVTGEQQLLLSPRGMGIPQSRPQVSPDGKMIYFVQSTETGGQALSRFDLTSRQQIDLRTLPEYGGFTSFQISPQGDQLAYLFMDDTGRRSILAVMPSSGGAAREIHRDKALGPTRFSGLLWSPDQKQILMVQENELGPAGALRGGSFWKVPVTGGAAEPVGIAMPGMVRFPTFDPISKRLYFAAVGGADPAVWLIENFLPRK